MEALIYGFERCEYTVSRNKKPLLERQIHGSVWSVEEDALAFLTDAGLVGRFTMDNQGRWPSEDKELLPSKIGECVWWLAVLTERMELDFADCVEQFLNERLTALE